MNNATLTAIVDEMRTMILGQKVGKIYNLSKREFCIDLRLRDGLYLYLNLNPGAPSLYLIRRKLKEIEKSAVNPPPFALTLRKHISNGVLTGIEKDLTDRVIRFTIAARDDFEQPANYTLIAELTGSSGNLLLLDRNDAVADQIRPPRDRNQPGQKYQLPPSVPQHSDGEPFPKGKFATLSDALDAHYRELKDNLRFHERVSRNLAELKQRLKKKQNLVSKLNEDKERHGDASKWKRYGELLLANLSTFKREDGFVVVEDFFVDPPQPVRIPVDDDRSIPELAETYFSRYGKAKRAAVEIEQRLSLLKTEIEHDEIELNRFQSALESKDRSVIKQLLGDETEEVVRKKQEKSPPFKGVRRYLSSEGIEILVGKASKDNDQLTFKIAKSLDYWFHAADYGGSHVVVRNPNRAELKQKTLIEAAQLAAYFSQAKEQPKVAVHYTQKKFVNKPKGAAPGLVSLSSFKTILVEPMEAAERMY